MYAKSISQIAIVNTSQSNDNRNDDLMTIENPSAHTLCAHAHKYSHNLHVHIIHIQIHTNTRIHTNKHTCTRTHVVDLVIEWSSVCNASSSANCFVQYTAKFVGVGAFVDGCAKPFVTTNTLLSRWNRDRWWVNLYQNVGEFVQFLL